MRKWTAVYENRLETYMKSRERILKAIRKVQNNDNSTIGTYPSLKNFTQVQFESSLEADFIRLLEFDLKVDRYVDQPIKIQYHDKSGKKRSYTPDFIVYFRDDPKKNGAYHCPLLVEVKSRSMIKKNWTELKPKFIAAMRYCDEVGWKFKIKTEKEIKTQFTENIKFLLPYMQEAPDYGLIEQVYYALGCLGDPTVRELISFYSTDPLNQAALVAPLWYLVGNQRVGCDLGKKLTANSKLWIMN